MNVFEKSDGDARQTEATAVRPEHYLFRKRYRKLTADEVALHDAIKDKANELALLIAAVHQRVTTDDATDDGAEVRRDSRITCIYLAYGHLEDAVYRAVKALTG